MPDHLLEDDHNRCQLHGDHSRRLNTIETGIGSIRSCQTEIKLGLTSVTERVSDMSRRIDEASIAKHELSERVTKMKDKIDERDKEQDKKINKLSVQFAVLAATFQTILMIAQHIFAK